MKVSNNYSQIYILVENKFKIQINIFNEGLSMFWLGDQYKQIRLHNLLLTATKDVKEPSSLIFLLQPIQVNAFVKHSNAW